jgi:hypothetical protein
MQIEYQLTEADFVNASQFSILHRTPWRRVRLWFFRLAGITFVALALPILFRPDHKLSGIFMFFCGLYAAFFSVATKFDAKRKFKKMTQLHGNYIVNIDSQGVRYTAPKGESKMDWKVWGSFAEDPSSFVLVQRGSTMFMPIPKRQLSTSEVNELRSLFQTYLPSK